MTGRERHPGGKASWGWAAEGPATIYKETACDCHLCTIAVVKSECVRWYANQRVSRVPWSSRSMYTFKVRSLHNVQRQRAQRVAPGVK